MHQHSFIGNLTRDCRMGQSGNGNPVSGFSVAVNDRRTGKTTYIDCSLWGKQAESLEQYLTKGTKVYIQGAFGTDEYNGNTKITCNVAILELLGGRDRTSNDADTSQTRQDEHRNLDDEIPF